MLKKFAWPPLLKATEEREKRIEAQLAEAERSNAEAQTLLEEHKKLLAESRTKAHAHDRRGQDGGGEGARGGAGEDAAGAGGAAGAGPAGHRRGARTGRSRSSGARRWTCRWRPRPSCIGQRLDTETDRKLVQDYLARLEQPELRTETDRPQLRRGAVRAGRASRAAGTLRRPDRRGGRRGRDCRREVQAVLMSPRVTKAEKARLLGDALKDGATRVRAVSPGGGEARPASAAPGDCPRVHGAAGPEAQPGARGGDAGQKTGRQAQEDDPGTWAGS